MRFRWSPQVACLALHYLTGMGLMAKLKLLEHCPDVSHLFRLTASDLYALGLTPEAVKALQSFNPAMVERVLAWEQVSDQHHVLTLKDSDYPPQLLALSDPPLALCVVGDVSLLQAPQVAVVGSRKPTPIGRQIAHDFSKQFAESALVVTSGLALGIDGAAHQGALEGGGKTLAVLGCGVDVLYPKRHRSLAQAIADKGALVSELPLGAPPVAFHFLQRNRIISGLSMACVVVEAAERSGSLCTARLANEQGREVYAVPGSIGSSQSAGCHHLIQQGAHCLTQASELLEHWPAYQTPSQKVVQEAPSAELLTQDQQKVYDQIQYETVDADTLAEKTGLAWQDLHMALIALEQLKMIQPYLGGYIRLGY